MDEAAKQYSHDESVQMGALYCFDMFTIALARAMLEANGRLKNTGIPAFR